MALHVRTIADPALLQVLGRIAGAEERIANALESLGGETLSEEDVEKLRGQVEHLRARNTELEAAVHRHTNPKEK